MQQGGVAPFHHVQDLCALRPLSFGKAPAEFQQTYEFIGCKVAGMRLPVHEMGLVEDETVFQELSGIRGEHGAVRVAVYELHHLLQRPACGASQLPQAVGAPCQRPNLQRAGEGAELPMEGVGFYHIVRQFQISVRLQIGCQILQEPFGGIGLQVIVFQHQEIRAAAGGDVQVQGGAGLLRGLGLPRIQESIIIFPDFDAAVRGVPVELGDAARQIAVSGLQDAQGDDLLFGGLVPGDFLHHGQLAGAFILLEEHCDAPVRQRGDAHNGVWIDVAVRPLQQQPLGICRRIIEIEGVVCRGQETVLAIGRQMVSKHTFSKRIPERGDFGIL